MSINVPNPVTCATGIPPSDVGGGKILVAQRIAGINDADLHVLLGGDGPEVSHVHEADTPGLRLLLEMTMFLIDGGLIDGCVLVLDVMVRQVEL